MAERNISGWEKVSTDDGTIMPSEDPELLIPCDYCRQDIYSCEVTLGESDSGGCTDCKEARTDHILAKRQYATELLYKSVNAAVIEAFRRGLSKDQINMEIEKVELLTNLDYETQYD